MKKAIDEGLPCYGWELDIAEFYVVHGYDETGYYYRSFDNSSTGPKPWRELGDTGIGVIEMYVVKPGQAVDDATTVKEAFKFTLQHSKSPEKWIFPKYKAGLDGFDTWIRAFETGKADGFGNAYNTVVWNECRQFAVSFLEEAKTRLGGELVPLFDEAIENYRVVAENLESMTKIFPFTGPNTKGDEIKDPERVRKGLKHLRAAREAEESGLKALGNILERL